MESINNVFNRKCNKTNIDYGKTISDAPPQKNPYEYKWQYACLFMIKTFRQAYKHQSDC